jgi:hypothetical protein
MTDRVSRVGIPTPIEVEIERAEASIRYLESEAKMKPWLTNMARRMPLHDLLELLADRGDELPDALKERINMAISKYSDQTLRRVIAMGFFDHKHQSDDYERDVKPVSSTSAPRCVDCGAAEIDTSFLPTFLCRQCYRKRLQTFHER